MKEQITKFDINAAFKALDEIEVPVVKGIRANRINLHESMKKVDKFELLMEDYYDVADQDDLEAASTEREDEIAKAKLARIEKIVDLDADSPEELLPSYVGKVIIQCPQCMTLFYKNQEDIIADENDPDTVNVGEKCQHCGNEDGYTVIGKVAEAEESEYDNYDAEEQPAEEAAEEENELDLDFDEEENNEESEEDLNLDLEAEEEPAEEEKKEESFTKPTGDALLEDISEETNEQEPLSDEEKKRFDICDVDKKEENKEELTEAADADLNKKLAEHNEYIDYLQKMIKQEEAALDKADNEFVKKAIQRRLDAFKQDLEEAIPDEVKNTEPVGDIELPEAEEAEAELDLDKLEEPAKEEKKEDVKESLNNSKVLKDIKKDNELETEHQSTKLTLNEGEDALADDISDVEFKQLLNSKEFKTPISDEEVRGYFESLKESWDAYYYYKIKGVDDLASPKPKKDEYKNKLDYEKALEEWEEDNENIADRHLYIGGILDQLNKDGWCEARNEDTDLILDNFVDFCEQVAHDKHKPVKGQGLGKDDYDILSYRQIENPNWSRNNSGRTVMYIRGAKLIGWPVEWSQPKEATIKTTSEEEFAKEMKYINKERAKGLDLADADESLKESNEAEAEPIEAKKFEDENKTEVFTELPDYDVEVEQKGDKIEIELMPKDAEVEEEDAEEKVIATEENPLADAIAAIAGTQVEDEFVEESLEEDAGEMHKAHQNYVPVATLQAWIKDYEEHLEQYKERMKRGSRQSDPEAYDKYYATLSKINEFKDAIKAQQQGSNEKEVEVEESLNNSKLLKEIEKDNELKSEEDSENLTLNEAKEEAEEEVDDEQIEVAAEEEQQPEEEVAVSFEPQEVIEVAQEAAEEVKGEELTEEESEAIAEKVDELVDEKVEAEEDAEDEEVEIEFDDIEDIDEEAIDECVSKYLTDVYENVNNFTMTGCKLANNELIVEGVINFKSGNKNATEFKFGTQNAKLLEGVNSTFANGTFKLACKVEDKKLIAESLNYSYKINETLVEGLATRK